MALQKRKEVNTQKLIAEEVIAPHTFNILGGINMPNRTFLYIMPFEEEGKILLLFTDQENHLKTLNGDDSALYKGLCLSENLSTIENIVVEFDDGVPVRVHVV